MFQLSNSQTRMFEEAKFGRQRFSLRIAAALSWSESTSCRVGSPFGVETGADGLVDWLRFWRFRGGCAEELSQRDARPR